jgi:predicted mannosyl-3-phosphoglycerate phosphatase (HAD superfamily)
MDSLIEKVVSSDDSHSSVIEQTIMMDERQAAMAYRHERVEAFRTAQVEKNAGQAEERLLREGERIAMQSVRRSISSL